MERINWKFTEKFGGHWIKVKFYKEKPNFLPEVNSPLVKKEVKRLKGVRFCEATKEAIIQPILLDKESISCLSAQYTFGWRHDYKNKLLDNCFEKRQTQKGILKSLLSRMLCLDGSINYIGLNTEGEPDLVMSYMLPEKIMHLIKIYHDHKSENLDVPLCSMMSICGGIAVRTYLERKISISFGCNDSRKYADIRRENLAIGIPNKLFKIFID